MKIKHDLIFINSKQVFAKEIINNELTGNFATEFSKMKKLKHYKLYYVLTDKEIINKNKNEVQD